MINLFIKLNYLILLKCIHIILKLMKKRIKLYYFIFLVAYFLRIN